MRQSDSVPMGAKIAWKEGSASARSAFVICSHNPDQLSNFKVRLAYATKKKRHPFCHRLESSNYRYLWVHIRATPFGCVGEDALPPIASSWACNDGGKGLNRLVASGPAITVTNVLAELSSVTSDWWVHPHLIWSTRFHFASYSRIAFFSPSVQGTDAKRWAVDSVLLFLSSCLFMMKK
jgi:hypothetical protein